MPRGRSSGNDFAQIARNFGIPVQSHVTHITDGEKPNPESLDAALTEMCSSSTISGESLLELNENFPTSHQFVGQFR